MTVANLAESAASADQALGILIDKLGLPNPDDPLPPGPWDPVIRSMELGKLFPTWHAGDIAGRPFPEPWRAFDLRALLSTSNGADIVAGPYPEPWRVFDRIAGPHPDPWRAYDPYGSLASPWRGIVLEVIRRRHPEVNDAIGGWGGGWERVTLNPQPLPPRWAFAVAAASELVKRAETIGEVAKAAGADGGGANWLAVLIDDFCGTPPRPWPWPWPGPRPDWLLDPVDAADFAAVAGVLSVASRVTFDQDLARGLEEQAGRLAEESAARLG